MSVPWTREHQLVALHLYRTERFGLLDSHTPRIVDLAERLGRTPASVSMKACNFASLDPEFLATGRKGLPGASKSDGVLWEQFVANPAAIGLEMESALDQFNVPRLAVVEDCPVPSGPSEVVVTQVQRRHQRFFREQLLAAYEGSCAITGLNVPELNIASHIIPWSVDETRRADPTNGILLSALFDRAFDRGLIMFENSRLVCSRALQREESSRRLLLEFSGVELRRPERFGPDQAALEWHRTHRWVDR